MTISQTIINITDNYDLFKPHFFNRSLQKRNLLNIKESVLRNNLLSKNPIIVTNEMEIIDGFHRYHVCKELNLPIHYITCDKFDIQMLIDLNFSVSKWGPFQFLELYCKLDKEEYIKFKNFKEHFEFDIYLALPLTKKRDNRRNLNEKFRRGEFVFDEEEKTYRQTKCALEFLETAKELLLFKPKPHKGLAFFDAYFKIMEMEGFEQELMISKLKKFGLQLIESASMSNYVNQLSGLLKKR